MILVAVEEFYLPNHRRLHYLIHWMKDRSKRDYSNTYQEIGMKLMDRTTFLTLLEMIRYQLVNMNIMMTMKKGIFVPVFGSASLLHFVTHAVCVGVYAVGCVQLLRNIDI